jgi:hypothetical protein
MFMDFRIFEEKTVARCSGYKITMDGMVGQEKEPHLHIFYNEEKLVSVCIRDGRVLVGRTKLPKKVRISFQTWLACRRKMLLEDWRAMQTSGYPKEYGEIADDGTDALKRTFDA